MQFMASGTRGLGLLFEVNSDRILLVLFLLGALAAVGIVEFESNASSFVGVAAPLVSAVL